MILENHLKKSDPIYYDNGLFEDEQLDLGEFKLCFNIEVELDVEICEGDYDTPPCSNYGNPTIKIEKLVIWNDSDDVTNNYDLNKIKKLLIDLIE